MKPVLISLNSNMAAASLRLEKWEATVAAASAALELDPQNSKALFRRGSARSKLGQLASAKDDLLSACRADPKDRNARAELEAVTERLKAQKAEEKATFAQKYQATAEKALPRRRPVKPRASVRRRVRSRWSRRAFGRNGERSVRGCGRNRGSSARRRGRRGFASSWARRSTAIAARPNRARPRARPRLPPRT